MKKILLLGASFLILIVSCKKQETTLPSSTIENKIDPTWLRYPIDTIFYAKVNSLINTKTYPQTSYLSLPSLNVFLPSPTKSVVYTGITYNGGPFQACVYSISGNSITFQVKRTDGHLFSKNSIISIKSTTPGGAVIKSISLPSSVSTYSFIITESNTWNISSGGQSNHNNTDKFVATWYNPDSKYSFYTQPIEIVAVPIGYGALLGNLQNVNVYSNGYGGFWGTNDLLDAACNNSQKYQCVHFIQNYYLQIKKRNIGTGYAGDYWKNNTAHGLTQKILNGAGIPQQGDVICFYNNSSGDYHAAIVNGVPPNTSILRVFHENVGQNLRTTTNNYCTPSSDLTFVKTNAGYNVKAADALGDNWITLGWLR